MNETAICNCKVDELFSYSPELFSCCISDINVLKCSHQHWNLYEIHFTHWRKEDTDCSKNKLISCIFLWKKQTDSAAPTSNFKKESAHSDVWKKRLSKRKEKPFLTARAWFPFKYPQLDSTHYAIVPPLICHSNRSVCQILIPLSVAGWLNGFLPVGLMSLLPFRSRTKLPKHSWNREHQKAWVLQTYPRLAEAYRLSSVFIFITGSCVLAFVKPLIWTLATLPIYSKKKEKKKKTLPKYNHYTQHCPNFC